MYIVCLVIQCAVPSLSEFFLPIMSDESDNNSDCYETDQTVNNWVKNMMNKCRNFDPNKSDFNLKSKLLKCKNTPNPKNLHSSTKDDRKKVEDSIRK